MQIRTNILVATDLCGACDRAAEYAFELAGETNASVHLIHGAYPEGNPDNFPPSGDRSDHQIAQLLERWTRSIGRPEPTATRVIRSASPPRAIVEYAEANDIDLIVMGVERKGLAGLLAGDRTGRKIIELASCPVTVLGPRNRPDTHGIHAKSDRST